jgi:hypothetical protein
MKEFTQSITLLSPYPYSEAATVPGSSAAGQSASSLFPLRLLASPFTFDPEPNDDDGGLSYRCDMDFIVDLPSKSAMSQLSRPRECIVELYDSEGNAYQIGTITMPARASLTPHLQSARLHVVSTMLFSPLQHPM